MIPALKGLTTLGDGTNSQINKYDSLITSLITDLRMAG